MKLCRNCGLSWACTLILLLSLFSPIPSAGLQIPPEAANLPPGEYSGIDFGDKSDTLILEDDLASTIFATALIKDGKPNVLNATFLFQECFGGGMLNALSTPLGEIVKWVGGSASKFNKPSFPNKDGTMDAWTEALVPELGVDQTLLSAINSAADNDARGPNAERRNDRREDPQAASNNGGKTIKLVEDPAAKSYVAVLWGGDAEPRHTADLKKIEAALTDPNNPNAWGSGANVNIVTLTGNDATRQKLVDTLTSVTFGNDVEFLFYATDHGHRFMVSPRRKEPIKAGEEDTENFSLDPGELSGIRFAETTVPTLTIDYTFTGPLTPYTDAVMLNGVRLGFLNAGLTEEQFVLPESALSLGNVITISNNELSPDSLITLNNKFFDTGAITTTSFDIPEPCSIALVLLALLSLAVTRRKYGLGQPTSCP